MNNLSERVQREFNEWKEIYEIPYNMEFQVKTLLKLQEEYDNVDIGSNTTKTRETLLHMIQNLQKELCLDNKQKTKMYIDYAVKEDRSISKIFAYIDNEMYTLKEEIYKNISDYASKIKSIAKSKNAVIYVDSRGFGMAIYDELLQDKDLVVKQLDHKKDFMF